MADVNKLKNKARREEQRENWSRAIDLYKRALKESLSKGGSTPDLSLYNRIGDIYLRLGDEEKAVSHYEDAISRYASDELHTSAIALCNKVLRVLPSRVGIFRRLGKLHAATGLVAEARVNFLRYVDAMDESGRADEALEALRECVEDTADAEAALRLADRLVDAGRTEEAVERLRAMVEAAREAGRDVPEVEERLEALADDAAREAATRPESSEDDTRGEAVLRELELELSGEAAPERSEPPEGPEPVEGVGSPADAPRPAAEAAAGRPPEPGAEAGAPAPASPPTDEVAPVGDAPAAPTIEEVVPAGDEPGPAEPGAGEEGEVRDVPPLRRRALDPAEAPAGSAGPRPGAAPSREAVEAPTGPSRPRPRPGAAGRPEAPEPSARRAAAVAPRRGASSEAPERSAAGPRLRRRPARVEDEPAERRAAVARRVAGPGPEPERPEGAAHLRVAGPAPAVFAEPGERPADSRTRRLGTGRRVAPEAAEGPVGLLRTRPVGRKPAPEPGEAPEDQDVGLAELLSGSRWGARRDGAAGPGARESVGGPTADEPPPEDSPARRLLREAAGAPTNGRSAPDGEAGASRFGRVVPAALPEPSLALGDVWLPRAEAPAAEGREPALVLAVRGAVEAARAGRQRAETAEAAAGTPAPGTPRMARAEAAEAAAGAPASAPFSAARAEAAEAAADVDAAEVVARCRRAVEAARAVEAPDPAVREEVPAPSPAPAEDAPVRHAAAPSEEPGPAPADGPEATAPAEAATAPTSGRRDAAVEEVPPAETSEPATAAADGAELRPAAAEAVAGEASEPPLESPEDAAHLVRAAREAMSHGDPAAAREDAAGPVDDVGVAGPRGTPVPARPVTGSGSTSADERSRDSAFREWVSSAPTALLHDTREELESRNEIRKALLVVERLLEVDGSDPWLHRKRIAYARELDDAEALPRAILALGTCLEERGERREAREAYTDLLELDPRNAAARAALEALERGEVEEEARAREGRLDRPATRDAATRGDAGAAGRGDADAAGEPPAAGSAPADLPAAETPASRAPDRAPGRPGTAGAGSGRPEADPPVNGAPGRSSRGSNGAGRGADPSVPRVGSPGPTPYDRIGDSGEVDFEELLTELRTQLVERDPNPDTRSRTELGAELKEMGLLDDAIRELQAAVREPNASPEAFELLGEAFIDKGQPRVAARLLAGTIEEARQSDRQLLGVLYQLGIAYEQVDDRQAALDCYERIFSVNIDYRDVQQRIRACAG